MKRSSIVVLALMCVSLSSYGAKWGGVGGSSWNDKGWMRGGFGGHNSAVPASRNMSFARNSTFTHGIVSHQHGEMVPNHYYFHNEGGLRYWHFYDHAGLHWYGLYFGPRFFWFPFYSGYWWWWDVNFSRWVWWSNGYWWWYGPGGVAYVDVNDQYVPYDQYAQQQAKADPSQKMPDAPSAPPSAPPSIASTNTPAKEGGTWKSPDGKRMVQVVESGQAFLYDESSSPPSLMKTLAPKDVEGVRYSGGTSEKPLQILVEYKDGSFAVFDSNGNPTQAAKK